MAIVSLALIVIVSTIHLAFTVQLDLSRRYFIIIYILSFLHYFLLFYAQLVSISIRAQLIGHREAFVWSWGN